MHICILNIFYIVNSLPAPFAVGYGTQTPMSLTGKAIGGLCAVAGVFILTLPVPIVVNSFASYYKNRSVRKSIESGCWRETDRLK